MAGLLDLESPWLYASVACIVFNPLAWNIVARGEYNDKLISKRLGKLNGWRALAATIFTMGIVRTWLFQQAIDRQPTFEVIPANIADQIASILFVIGGGLVLSSWYHLGFTHTYLGDYFGYLMKERVTAFPFSVLDNPMYWGSTLEYFAMALRIQSPAGMLLTFIVYVVYYVAVQYEGAFTAMIYANPNRSTSGVSRSHRVRK